MISPDEEPLEHDEPDEDDLLDAAEAAIDATDDGSDDEDEGEDGDSEEGAEEGAGPKKKKGDEEEEVQHPDTPIPTLKVMRSALDWAFEGEDDITDELLDKFAAHAVSVLTKNRVMNLTAIFDPREVAAKHYLDSWRVTRLVPLMARKVLDLGTGPGFPGIPLALAEPNLSMTLIDSTRKKVDYLEEVCAELDIRNAHPVWARVEDHLATNHVDVVVARAISSVRENVRLLRKVRHSLKDYVMLKGKSWSREVRAAEREAERLGFKLDTVWEHELPGDMGQRAILVYQAPGGAGL